MTDREKLSATELRDRLSEKESEIRKLRAALAEWEGAWAATPKRDDTLFTSVSGREVNPLYTPGDLEDGPGYLDSLGFPGEFPFTRGPYSTMYRTRLWTMRQFAGFATAEETNQRYKYLLANGQTGLSVAFDFPTLMGYDSDHPRSLGEVGVCGVAISSPGRHGNPLRRDPSGSGLRVHDHQRSGHHPLRLLCGGGGEAGGCSRESSGAPPKTTS